MKKYIYLLLTLVILFIYSVINTQVAFASTLYSNTFNNTSLSDWTLWSSSDHCSDGTGSLNTLNNTRCAMKYNSSFNNLVCVSADINTTITSRDIFFFTRPTDGVDNWAIAFAPDNGSRDMAIIVGFGSTTTSAISTPIGVHNYAFCKDGNTYRGYLDNNEVVNVSAPVFNIVGFSLGIDLDKNSAGNPINNFIATDSLPNPPQTSLPVPLIKQTDASWKNETYDLANFWSPTDDTIGTWGCALTSATMVLNYYNITNLPGFGNTLLNPYTLGQWLDTQPDGYIPNGNVNWLAISRLSKQAKSNNSTLLDALEYKRSNFADTTTLLADLNANHPDILEEPGHFVVATGQSGSTYTINDPYYNRTDLTTYGNTFLSLGRFVPSFTDLSYILLTADPSLTITLKDSNNNPIGTSYVQQPLTGAETGLTAGNPITLLYAPQPDSGAYTLTVSGASNQIYSIKVYLYDKDGNVKPFTQTGVTGPNNQNAVTINFDNQNLNNDSTQKQITITTFLDDLTILYSIHQIKKNAYMSLGALGKNAQKHIQKHDNITTKVNLGVLKTLLAVDKKIGLLTDTAYQILLADVQYLQNHL